MSTPIEIVRAEVAYLTNPAIYHFAEPEDKKRTEALASVLRDAERFRAMERAHRDDDQQGWALEFDQCVLCKAEMPLAELADRLMEENK